MATSAVTSPEISSAGDRSPRLTLLAAFFAIYVLWGTTFLAIRVAVAELPPLFAAGARFFIAGGAIYAFFLARGQARVTLLQLRNLAVMALLMFVIEYGLLFWAEKYTPSGVASLLAATQPLLTLIFEMTILRRDPFRWSLLGSTLLGFAGVGVLLIRGGGPAISLLPSLAILAATMSWSLGSVLTRSMDLPKSRPLTAGVAMMLGGFVLLLLSAGFGELHPFPYVTLRAGLAVLYLISVGSLLAFTAYVWLLDRMPAARVASHAYVNPVVAVALGYFLAHEAITWRTLLGAVLVLLSVFLVLRTPKQKAA